MPGRQDTPITAFIGEHGRMDHHQAVWHALAQARTQRTGARAQFIAVVPGQQRLCQGHSHSYSQAPCNLQIAERGWP